MLPEKRKKLYALLEQRTRAEIMSRHCPFFNWPDWGQMYFDMQEIDNQIRELLYGTSDLVKLGHRWNLPINPPTEQEQKRRANIKKEGRETKARIERGLE